MAARGQRSASPSDASARLLAADANTYVRFVPSANWNGTLASGISFRAWDRSSGTAGGTADTSTNGGASDLQRGHCQRGDQRQPGQRRAGGHQQDRDHAGGHRLHLQRRPTSASPTPTTARPTRCSAVKITTLPGAGSLTNNGVAVSAGRVVTLADITGGQAEFTPAADANGAGYASFTFQVQDDGGTANGGVDLDATARTMTIDVTPVNDAPVLTGANNLTAIDEDPAANAGTLVSALIAGQVSDADDSAATGIAVTAVDNTNGTWQYSTDGGSTWTAFGSPSAASARLLAADANTYVRFVPNANWNGTVASGITFRAWDQTSGSGGRHGRHQQQRGHQRLQRGHGQRGHHGQRGQRCAGGREQHGDHAGGQRLRV